MKFRHKKFVFLLIGITFITYFLSLANPFIWDDEQFIQKNVYVQTFDIGKIFTTNTVAGAGVSSNYYRPLTSLSFALDTKLWGMEPFGFHLTNTTLHILAGVLLFYLLLELGFSGIISFFVSLFFLIHPTQVEAVVYINSRGDSLFTALLFASLLLFAKSIGISTRKALFMRIASCVLFILSILAKETALVGIFLYPGLLLLNARKHNYPIKTLFRHYPHEIITAAVPLISAICYMVLRLTILRFGNIFNFYTTQDAYSQHVLVRLLTFSKILWIYIGILIFPVNLHMERLTPYVTSFLSPWPYLTILLLFIMVWFAIREYIWKKTLFITISLFFFLLFLIPVSGILPINGLLYEHWLYIPLIGFFLFLISSSLFLVSNTYLQKIRKKLIYFGILLSILYCFASFEQILVWANPITFYTYTLKFSQSARVYNNLGISYAQVGDLPDAATAYKKALSLTPTYPEIHNNLANIYKAQRKFSDAEAEYKRALLLNSNFTTAFLNLADLYLQQKSYARTLIFLEDNAGNKAFNTSPTFHFLMGYCFYKLNQFEKAENKFNQAIQMSRNDPAIINAVKAIKQGNIN